MAINLSTLDINLTGELSPAEIQSRLATLDAGLQCGQNEALNAISELTGSIKSALADGKAALGELNNIQGQLLEKLNEVQTPEFAGQISSFQEDIQALQTKVGEEFAQAKQAVLEKYEGAVNDLEEIVSSIPSLEDILNGVEIPNVCDELPRVEIRESVDEAGNVIREVAQLAAEAPVSSGVAEPAAAFESSVVDLGSQPSTTSPSGLSRTDVYSSFLSDVYLPVTELTRDFWEEVADRVATQLDEFKEEPEFNSIMDKMRTNGITGAELQERGLLTESEIEFRGRFVEWRENDRDRYTPTQNLFINTITTHKRYLVGAVNEEFWNGFLEGALAELELYDGADTVLQEIIDLQESKRDVIQNYNRYSNRV